MKLRMGLNPYGLTYHLGLQAAGTPRANPRAVGLDGFLALAEEFGARVVELSDHWLGALDETGLAALRQRLERGDIVPVISSGLHHGDVEACIRYARALGADRMRFALTPILCGDRAAAGAHWYELVASTRRKLADAAPKAEAAGLLLLIENHQDFTSRELVGFCEEFGPAVRIVYDTANNFPVAEAPLDFTRVVAPYVRYVHAKDYRVQFTPEGYRLCRCPSGDGAVPFRELFDILAEHNDTMLAAIEIGALEARHVRLFTPGWWHGYPPKPAEELAAALYAAQRNKLPEDADYRTPWERGADDELADYELAQLRRSVANMRALGFM
ncbi:MAG TPA: sugar phosphate isomerase/epimerase [Alphaproteobacteria bacterium]|nr:sugar phosphate isomerase/epimerase [Alphaproteobacteria bacterium]